MAEEKLALAHLEAVAHLQEVFYPEPFRVAGQRLVEKLQLLEQTPPFLSWILFDSGQATGYLIAFPARSRIDSDIQETVISIDDLMIQPGRPHDLFKLLKLLRESALQAGLQQLAVEATCRRGAYEIITSHPRIVERLGYEWVAEQQFWAPDFGEELTWVRYHPVRDAEISMTDSTCWSQELREEALRLRQRV